MKFDDFCDKCLPAADLARPPQTFWLLGADGKLGVDRVVKFHTLQEEMDQIADYYDLPLRNLPNLLNHSPPDYCSIFTKRTRELVGSIYAEEIEMFGFSFDDESNIQK